MALKYYLKANGKMTSQDNPSEEMEKLITGVGGCTPCDKNGNTLKIKKVKKKTKKK